MDYGFDDSAFARVPPMLASELLQISRRSEEERMWNNYYSHGFGPSDDDSGSSVGPELEPNEPFDPTDLGHEATGADEVCILSRSKGSTVVSAGCPCNKESESLASVVLHSKPSRFAIANYAL